MPTITFKIDGPGMAQIFRDWALEFGEEAYGRYQDSVPELTRSMCDDLIMGRKTIVNGEDDESSLFITKSDPKILKEQTDALRSAFRGVYPATGRFSTRNWYKPNHIMNSNDLNTDRDYHVLHLPTGEKVVSYPVEGPIPPSCVVKEFGLNEQNTIDGLVNGDIRVVNFNMKPNLQQIPVPVEPGFNSDLDDDSDDRILDIRREILEQVARRATREDDGLVYFIYKGELHHGPKGALINWGNGLKTGSDVWTPVSYQGFKMYGDNPNHTDFIIGSCISIDDAYEDSSDEHGLYTTMLDLFEQISGGNPVILNAGRKVAGPIKVCMNGDEEITSDTIIIIPNLSPKFLPLAQRAAGVIAENGGQTAHLVQCMLDSGTPIVMMPNAIHTLCLHNYVAIDTTYRGTRLHENCGPRVMFYDNPEDAKHIWWCNLNNTEGK